MHRLMQSLPDIPVANRRKAADDYLARAGKELSQEQRTKIAEQMMLIIEHPHFYELFVPGSRAEVPIVGKLQLGGETVRVSGQIDRLTVTQDSVLIADFKTNRPPPRQIEDVPPAYVRQLALYRAVLTKLYPEKFVRAALVWTEVPDLMELSAEVWMPRWRGSRPRDSALTLPDRVHSFHASHSRAILRTKNKRKFPWPSAKCRTQASNRTF